MVQIQLKHHVVIVMVHQMTKQQLSNYKKLINQFIIEKLIIILIDRCCNTCEDVKEAYRQRKWQLPDLKMITQCKHDRSVEKLKNAFLEGCQIFGNMEVNRVGGSFHISPGDSFSINHMHGKSKYSFN